MLCHSVWKCGQIRKVFRAKKMNCLFPNIVTMYEAQLTQRSLPNQAVFNMNLLRNFCVHPHSLIPIEMTGFHLWKLGNNHKCDQTLSSHFVFHRRNYNIKNRNNIWESKFCQNVHFWVNYFFKDEALQFAQLFSSISCPLSSWGNISSTHANCQHSVGWNKNKALPFMQQHKISCLISAPDL